MKVWCIYRDSLTGPNLCVPYEGEICGNYVICEGKTVFTLKQPILWYLSHKQFFRDKFAALARYKQLMRCSCRLRTLEELEELEEEEQEEYNEITRRCTCSDDSSSV